MSKTVVPRITTTLVLIPFIIMEEPSEYKVATAKMDHYPGVLTISKDVYDGHDYIEHVYEKWVREEETSPERRRNLVLLDGAGRVIGYRSMMFRDSGNNFVCQALRIDSSLRGQGLAKKFAELSKEILLQLNPKVRDFGDTSVIIHDRICFRFWSSKQFGTKICPRQNIEIHPWEK